MVAAAAAPPSPSPAPRTGGRPHPTYTKMITQALAELGGASPRAGIAGHIIGRGYSGLPARHDHLLSAHLRRLLAEGVLIRLDADSPAPTYLLAPKLAGEEQEKRGPGGRPPRNDAPAAPPAVKLGEKRGPGRPRKNPATQASSSSSLDKRNGIAANSAAPQPANRKRGLSLPTANPGNDDDHDDSVVTTKRGRQQGPEAFQNGGQEAGAFPIQNGGAVHVHVQSSGVRGGIKGGCGRPWKEKPPSSQAAPMSPESGNNNAASAGVKRGRGRPRKEKPPTGAAASRGFKRGCGRPSPSVSPASYANGVLRKERPLAGAKRGRGRPRKDHRVGGGLVEKRAYEVFFRDMMMAQASAGQEEEEDLVLSGEKTPQTEEGAALGDGRDTTRAAADAGSVPVSGEAAAGATAPAGAVDSHHLGPADLPADDVVSTGVKRGRGRPRKEKPAAAAKSAETGDDDASVVIEPEGRTPTMKKTAAAASSPETTGDAAAPTGVKRPRGRPRKNPPAAAMPAETRDAAAVSTGGVKRGRGRPPKKKPATAMSAETGDAASTGAKRGRGRPRKEKPAAAAAATGVAGVKRGRGRPMNASSVGTWYAESAAERELFGHMAQEEAPGDREEAWAADGTGRVPVSEENATAAPVEAGNGSGLGPASM